MIGRREAVPPQDDRLVLGVSALLAQRYDVDVSLVRLAFMILGLALGLGLLLYLALWFVLLRPDRSLGADGVRELARRVQGLPGAALEGWRSGDTRRSWPRPLDRRWIALGLIAGGLLLLVASLGFFSWVTLPRGLALGAILGGLAVLLRLG